MMILKTKLTPVVILTLLCGYIYVYDHYRQSYRFVHVYVRSQVSIYRTIGPLVRFTSFCCKNESISSKIYDNRDDFDFDIVNFPFFLR